MLSGRSGLSIYSKDLFYNPGQNFVNKFTKLSKIGFLSNVLQLIFCELLTKAANFGIWAPS